MDDAVKEYLSERGRIAGSAKSSRKTRACRRNAKKGGWPKGRKRGPRIVAGRH